MAAPNEKEKPKPPLAIGDVVAEKYRVESILGEGGMGFVFAATHLHLGHRVALKVLNSTSAADREVTERFLREGRAVARLQGEHVARVSDVGTIPTGEPYLVMEFLEGRDLAKELSARGPLPVAEVVEFIAQTCEALAEAHVRGIVHRDLKPANLFLSQKLDGEPLVKVLDFGISKITQGDEAVMDSDNITVTSSLVGTPKYMSPEQIQDSRSVDSRTDIWGLGTIFYELLTQNRPFAAPSLALVCVKILHEEVPAPSTIRADIPPGIDEIIARCLKKQAADRFSNVGELVEALVPFNPNAKASATRITRILAAKASGAKLWADQSGSFSGQTRVPSIVNADSSQPIGARTPSNVRIVEKENETLTAATLLEGSTAKTKSKRTAILAAGGGAGALVIALVLFFALRSPSATANPASSASAQPPHSVAIPEPTTPPTQVAAQPSVTTTATASAVASTTPSAKPHATARPGGGGVVVHHTNQTQSTSQGTGGDVLEDRR